MNGCSGTSDRDERSAAFRAEQSEDLVDFIDRISRLAEDWRYSNEFIGLLVRERWPRVYNRDRAFNLADREVKTDA